MSLWTDLPPDEQYLIPDFPTRISLCRLLIEVSMYKEALEVAERLVQEDDQSVEAWYLGGLAHHELGHHYIETRNGKQSNENTAEKPKEVDNLGPITLAKSREYLREALVLFEQLEYEDVRLREHAKELVEKLEKELEGTIYMELDGVDDSKHEVDGKASGDNEFEDEIMEDN